MTELNQRSTTDKFAIFSFTALFVAMGVRFTVAPENTPAPPETAALIESRLPTQQAVPLAQVLASQVQIERLMAAGLIDDQGLDQAFQLLEQTSYAIDGFIADKGLANTEQASLKMIRPDADLYQQYQAMSKLIERFQPGQ